MCKLHTEELQGLFWALGEVQSLWCPLPGPELDGRAGGVAVMAALGSFGGNCPQLFSAMPFLFTCMAPQPSESKI